MAYAITFIKLFFLFISVVAPILMLLAFSIVVLGLIVGRIENWKKSKAIYWSFITATTVGYGDIRPTRGLARFISVVIAVLGLILFGIIISVSVAATDNSAKRYADKAKIHSIMVSD
jgi:voltage-gated potassium channel